MKSTRSGVVFPLFFNGRVITVRGDDTRSIAAMLDVPVDQVAGVVGGVIQDLEQVGWGTPAMFTPNMLMSLQWNIASGAAIDIYIDDVEFLLPAGTDTGTDTDTAVDKTSPSGTMPKDPVSNQK